MIVDANVAAVNTRNMARARCSRNDNTAKERIA